MKFKLTGVLTEKEAIVTLTYNIRDYGYSPTHAEGPADSLNVASRTRPSRTSPGEYANPSEDYAYSFNEESDRMCGGTLGSLGPTGPCGTGYQPLMEIKAT